MPERNLSEPVVHQAIHGYRQGHQLLASSRDFDHETANVLGHNSDSAPRARASDGSYLTGYPLPDAGYVIAKTWVDTSAERPNTVVTRSLILPRSKPPGYSSERILDRLRRPTSDEVVGGRLDVIEERFVIGEMLRLSADEARVAGCYYLTDGPLVFPSEEGRERIAAAIWQQLWTPARYNLYFCTAPDSTRFGRMDRPLLFGGEGSRVIHDSKTPEAHQLIRDDLSTQDRSVSSSSLWARVRQPSG